LNQPIFATQDDLNTNYSNCSSVSSNLLLFFHLFHYSMELCQKLT